MSDSTILRGARARQILDDPLFVEAFNGLEQGAIEALNACDVHNKDRLQTLTMSLQTIRAVRRRFAVWIAEGEAEARKQMKREDAPTLFERFRRRA